MNKQNLTYLLIFFVFILGVFFFLRQSPENISETPEENNEEVEGETTEVKNETAMPTQTMQIDTAKQYTAIMETSEGVVKIQLFADKTPITVNNFVALSKKNFYNGTIFHRVISGFMIQGGDPEGTGAGGPGYQFDDELFEGDYTRGTVAMANAGPNTNGSQFFIMHADQDLPKNYVIFGKVIEGMETVDKIAAGEVTQNESGEVSKPVSPVKIKSVKIAEE